MVFENHKGFGHSSPVNFLEQTSLIHLPSAEADILLSVYVTAKMPADATRLGELKRSIHENIQGHYFLIILIFPAPWPFYVVH